MLEHHVPGVSVAVTRGNEPAIARGFGYGSLEENEPCTPDTLFDIASSAKSLTATAVALLVEDNENHAHLQYETPMSSLLPDDFVIYGTMRSRARYSSFYNEKSSKPPSSRILSLEISLLQHDVHCCDASCRS